MLCGIVSFGVSVAVACMWYHHTIDLAAGVVARDTNIVDDTVYNVCRKTYV